MEKPINITQDVPVGLCGLTADIITFRGLGVNDSNNQAIDLLRNNGVVGVLAMVITKAKAVFSNPKPPKHMI